MWFAKLTFLHQIRKRSVLKPVPQVTPTEYVPPVVPYRLVSIKICAI